MTTTLEDGQQRDCLTKQLQGTGKPLDYLSQQEIQTSYVLVEVIDKNTTSFFVSTTLCSFNTCTCSYLDAYKDWIFNYRVALNSYKA